ncbi:hypothetical protein FOBRF1_015163 [Fusarium oxysporum]
MAPKMPKNHRLTGLPTEILLDIYQQLDLDGVFNLCATHRTLHELFDKRKASILLPVLVREFSPFDELLQVYTASVEDLDSRGGLYAPRRVVFKRFLGDTGMVLAPRSEHQPAVSADAVEGFITLNKPSKPIIPRAQPLKTVVLTENDLKPLLGYCSLVLRWQARFPQMRWFHEPENCRLLREHEAERFRRAMYRWWLYGFYFHGDFPRPRVGLPEPGVDDVRLSQLRLYSTCELVELMDLVETMKDVVLHYLCPRLDPSQDEYEGCDSYLCDVVDRPDSLARGWRDQSRWGRIVKTYCKLGPKDLMHLFENIYSYPRKRLITEARSLQPNLTFDQESISVSTQCVLDERQWSLNMPTLPLDGLGGVIDWDDERDAERVKFGSDASLDGTLPGEARMLRSSSHYSPRGDDGSYLEDVQRQTRMEAAGIVRRDISSKSQSNQMIHDQRIPSRDPSAGVYLLQQSTGFGSLEYIRNSWGRQTFNAVDHPMKDAEAPNGFNRTSNTSIDDDDTASEDPCEEDEDPLPQDITFDQMRRRGLLPTGCCYDDRMKLHMNADFSPNAHHPEDPRRIHEIFKAFKKVGLVYTGPEAELPRIMRECPTRYMWRIPARAATREEICLAHHPDHFSWGGNLSMLVNVVTGQVKNAFAVIRPPGHHAEFDAPMGFCFFNNVPVAVRVCQQDYPDICRKVLILDWDVHHGNGVQNIFYQDPNVLYISLHVYQNGLFYPGKPPNDMTPDGGIDKCGTDAGLGKNINIGWHDQGMGDGEYMAAFQKIVMPIAKEFNPDLVVISAGFDAADGDELGGCFVSPSCYAHMTHMLMSLADGKVAVCLEGGYNLKAISVSAVAVAKTLMGEPPPKMEIPKINKEAARILAKVQAHQAPYWECMRAGIVRIPTDIQPAISSRLHDVIRNAQRQVLQTKHNMIPLYIQREHLYKSYENQVLVTPGLHKEKKVLIIIHDPPELLAQPDVIDRSVDPHNAWVVDGVTDYIDWAVDQKFGVMDVNIPAYVTHDEESDSYVPGFKEKALTEQIQTLVCYLWDNYLQLYDADHIFVMGVGNAYLGVKVLLINRDCKSRISGVVNFANGTLRPVKSEFDSDLSSWYKENSRVYIAGDHACWADPDLTRKVNKRRFGTVVRSPMFGLNKMMAHHAKEAREWILERVEEVADADMTEDEKS